MNSLYYIYKIDFIAQYGVPYSIIIMEFNIVVILLFILLIVDRNIYNYIKQRNIILHEKLTNDKKKCHSGIMGAFNNVYKSANNNCISRINKNNQLYYNNIALARQSIFQLASLLYYNSTNKCYNNLYNCNCFNTPYLLHDKHKFIILDTQIYTYCFNITSQQWK